MRYKAIKEYNDAPETPIQITKGETLEFIEESNPDGNWPNWILCKGQNKEGWVPKQILKIEGKQVTVEKDYIAREHNLKLNEILNAESELNGWIWGTKQDAPDVFAWAPLNCLEEV